MKKTKEEIKGLLPKVYDDTLSPSMRAVGQTMEAAVKLALRPANGLIWSVNRCADWVSEAISKKFIASETSSSKIIAPSPEMTMRVLLGLTTTMSLEDPIPKTMFAHLLGSSMVLDSVCETHPAFAEILRNMVSDECRMFAIIASQPEAVVYESFVSSAMAMNSHNELNFSIKESPLSEALGITTKKQLYLFINNLERLGLVTQSHHTDFMSRDTSSKRLSSMLDRYSMEFEKFKKKHKNNPRCPREIHITSIRLVRLTDWGRNFAAATGANHMYDEEKNLFLIPDWAR